MRKTLLGVALAAISLFGTWLPARPSLGEGLPGGSNADHDGIDDGLEAALIDRYSPLVFLHPEEGSKPSSVDWYLARTALRFHHDNGCPDHAILALSQVTQSNLWRQEHPTAGWPPFCWHETEAVRSDAARDVIADEGFFLQPPNDNGLDQIVHHGDPDPAGWRTYAHVFPSNDTTGGPGGYIIQYWFFYPYSDAPEVAGLDFNHEGDWEHMSVKADASGQFVHAYYAAHAGEGRIYQAGEMQFAGRDGNIAPPGEALRGEYTHPVVFSALGTHASYPMAGTIERGLLPPDRTGYGQVWNTGGNVVNVGEVDAPLNGQEFLRYAHLWGRIGVTPISSGPPGPAFHVEWLGY